MSNTMIEAGKLAKAIADHIKPIKTGCHVKNIGKATREHHPEHPNNWRHEDLSHADSELLAEIWRENDLPFDCPIEQADWPKYKTAFDESPKRPNWELTCGFNDWYLISRSENVEAAIQHQKAIEAASEREDLRLFTANLVPTNKVKPGTLIRRADAESYLDSIGLPVSLLDAKAEHDIDWCYRILNRILENGFKKGDRPPELNEVIVRLVSGGYETIVSMAEKLGTTRQAVDGRYSTGQKEMKTKKDQAAKASLHLSKS